MLHTRLNIPEDGNGFESHTTKPLAITWAMALGAFRDMKGNGEDYGLLAVCKIT